MRHQESLSESEQFIIIKLDIKNTSLNTTYVQYEIFNPNNYQKVSLDICKNIPIKIYSPVTLDASKLELISSCQEQGYNIFDINDIFYNDICATYTALNGADMTLSNRKTSIYDSMKEIYFCQTGCEFENFDPKTSKANCNCNAQLTKTFYDIKKISFEKPGLIDSFYNTLYNSNFRVLKCFKLLFSLKGIKSNLGFYIMTTLSGFFIVLIIIHILKGTTKIVKVLKNILKSKKKNLYKIVKINKIKRQISKRSKKIEKMKKLNAPLKKKNKSNKYELSNRINTPNLRENVVSTKDVIYEEAKEIEGQSFEKDKNRHNEENEKKINEKFQNLNDEELNDLDYEIACLLDKRTYCQYYYSLLKKDQLIIFTFIINDDYNLRQIKIILFIVSFSLSFTDNAFFFSDETMNKIYEDNGTFNIIVQLPQIFYSSLVSSIIDIILQKLSISEDHILDLKKEKDMKIVKEKALKIKKRLKIKLIIFLFISSIIMLFCFYFISCFCAAYYNTQLILIKDTLISFGTSMIYPFGFKLLPGIFRIPSLRASKMDQKCIYKISKILNLI